MFVLYRSGLPVLPPEILADIIARVPAMSVIRIWMCGSKLMNWKLSDAGAVRYLEFEYEPTKKDLLWPPAVENFSKLTTFKYSRSSFPKNAKLPSDLLLRLPTSLEKLSVSFRGSIALIAKALQLQPLRFSNLTSLKSRLMLVEDGEAPPILNALLPKSLLSLCMSNCHSSAKFHPCLDLNADLPALTVLKIQVSTIDHVVFPPTLTKLHLGLLKVTEPWMHKLPRGLVDLNVVQPSEPALDPVQEWRNLPPGLLHFDTTSTGPLTRERALALPSNLITLTVTGRETVSDVVALLPRTITNLYRILPDRCGVDFAKALPPLLQVADTTFELSSVPYLPPSMTDLRLGNETDNLNCPLPRSVTSLEVQVLTDEMVPMLPEVLRTLRVHAGKLTERSMAGLPRGLQELITLGPQPLASDKSLEFAPKNIRSYNLVALGPILELLPLCRDSSAWIGQNVTYLSLGECVTEAGWFSGLPASLRTIRMKIEQLSTEDLMELAIACPILKTLSFHLLFTNTQRLSVFTLATHFPTSCINVELRYQDIREQDPLLSNSHLLNLPPRLRSLSLPLAPLVDKEVLPYLPKTMQRVRLGYNTPVWFTDLEL